ncbi:hypothetical protein [Cohnella cellulosilytica]|uniref:N-acetyltransferase domain-containing protein n=1 Tax=Cohnella cellulosilytica TaxID=986710 RepID=A0ABW2FA04_9BACL
MRLDVEVMRIVSLLLFALNRIIAASYFIFPIVSIHLMHAPVLLSQAECIAGNPNISRLTMSTINFNSNHGGKGFGKALHAALTTRMKEADWIRTNFTPPKYPFQAPLRLRESDHLAASSSQPDYRR